MPALADLIARRDALLSYKEEKQKESPSSAAPSGSNASAGDEKQAEDDNGQETESSTDVDVESPKSEFLMGGKDDEKSAQKTSEKSAQKSNVKAPAKKGIVAKATQLLKEVATFVVNAVLGGIYYAYKFQQEMSQLRDSSMGPDEAQSEANKLQKEIEEEEAKRREAQAVRRAAFKEKYGNVFGLIKSVAADIGDSYKRFQGMDTVFSPMFNKAKNSHENEGELAPEEESANKNPTINFLDPDLRAVLKEMKGSMTTQEAAAGRHVKDLRSEEEKNAGRESTA